MGRSAGLVVGALLVVIGVVALVGRVGVGEETSTATFDGVTRLEFDVANGPLQIRAGGDETILDVTASTGWLAGEVEVVEDGGTLRVEHRCPSWFAVSCRAEIDVTLPATATVEGDASNGPLTLAGLDGPVDVSTSNGAVTLRDLSAAVQVRTSNGAIRGEGLRGASLDAGTSNGRIALDFAWPPTDVTLDTSNGSVEVVLPPEAPPYALSTDTSNGQVVADVRTDPSAEGRIDIDTSNGDITVRYGG